MKADLVERFKEFVDETYNDDGSVMESVVLCQEDGRYVQKTVGWTV